MSQQQQQRIIHAAAADIDEPVRLSPNFQMHEFDCHDGVSVPECLREQLKVFVTQNVQPIRDFVGVPLHIVSGYRHPAYNKAVQGKPWSFHQWGHTDGQGHPVNPTASAETKRAGKFAVDLSAQGIDPVVLYHVVLGMMRMGYIEPGGIGLYKWGVHYDNRGTTTRF